MRLLVAVARTFGFDLIRRNYYSPVPDLDGLADNYWRRRSPLDGISLDLESQIEYLESDLAGFVAEFDDAAGVPHQFHLDNDYYMSVDAEILYATVRRFKPERVLELGSGWSSLAISAACKANATDGHTTDHHVYDPFMSSLLTETPQGPKLHPTSGTSVALERFLELSQNDILFVDTSHTVKLGGEVNRIVLEVLPLLQPGVIVHFHDIFLPREYPREWFENRLYWSEQYLLQAFLAFNPVYDVLFATNAVVHSFPQRVARVVPSFRPETVGLDKAVTPGYAAFWLRRVA